MSKKLPAYSQGSANKPPRTIKSVPPKAKPRASDDEVYYLIIQKRQDARRGMAAIIHDLTAHDSTHAPQVRVLLDYLSNMIFALELLMKLLSNKWENHKVSAMYDAIFTTSPSDRRRTALYLMETALHDQKYLVVPTGDGRVQATETLADSIPDLELLFDDLSRVLSQRMPRFDVNRVFKVSEATGRWIARNTMRFGDIELQGGHATWKHEMAARQEEAERRRQRIDKLVNKHEGIEFLASHLGVGHILR